MGYLEFFYDFSKLHFYLQGSFLHSIFASLIIISLNKDKMKRIMILVLFSLNMHANAQDRLFTYTYQSNVLEKSQKELEIWTSMFNSREHFYRGFEHRIEFEVGLGKKLQTAFYLNSEYNAFIELHDTIEILHHESEFSFSNEWKYKLSDPVANAFGSALYFEYTLAPAETELELKFIIDKQSGKFLNAFNVEGEMEFEKEFEEEGNEIEVETEIEYKLNLFYGLAYNLSKNLSVGFELKNSNKFEDGELEYSILNAGPCFSWNTEGFWLNFSFMPQLTNLIDFNPELSHNEKFQSRLIFSYVF